MFGSARWAMGTFVPKQAQKLHNLRRLMPLTEQYSAAKGSDQPFCPPNEAVYGNPFGKSGVPPNKLPVTGVLFGQIVQSFPVSLTIRGLPPVGER
jgi:hypothetical protein